MSTTTTTTAADDTDDIVGYDCSADMGDEMLYCAACYDMAAHGYGATLHRGDEYAPVGERVACDICGADLPLTWVEP